jgi:hypothetical protein
MTTWLDEIERRSTAGQVPPGDQPWMPPILAEVPRATLRRLRYVVVDDIDAAVGDVVLVASAWPTVDLLGRVRHAADTAREQYVPVATWTRLLAKRRVPDDLRDRKPRIGDAFAMLLPRGGDVTKPKGAVVDITADAREAARMAFYGATSLPMEPHVAAEVRDPDATPRAVVATPPEWVAR